MTTDTLLWMIGAYLMGSIPFGLLLGFLTGKGDIRKIGSGNIGATNMMRAGGKKLAAITLILDGLKGFIPTALIVHHAPNYVTHRLAEMKCIGDCSLSLWQEMHQLTAYIFCIAILGHIFPVWLKFKGGKGVATFLGGLFGLHWMAGVIFIACWLGMFALKRISALAALAALFVAPFSVFLLTHNITLMNAVALMSVLIIYRHKDNISRLLCGSELCFKNTPKAPSVDQ